LDCVIEFTWLWFGFDKAALGMSEWVRWRVGGLVGKGERSGE
jgi:hypothetical protein